MKKASIADSLSGNNSAVGNSRFKGNSTFSGKTSVNQIHVSVSMDCDVIQRQTKPVMLEAHEADAVSTGVSMDARCQAEDARDSGYSLSLPLSASPRTDDRKRPLSISSTSSSASSSSSLPRHVRKRIANTSSTVSGSADADVGGGGGGGGGSCEMLSTVAECSPIEVQCSSSSSRFFEKDDSDGTQNSGVMGCAGDGFPASDSSHHYASQVIEDGSAASDVEESTSSSARNSFDCLMPTFDNAESKLLTGAVYIERVVTEILDTERNYVKDLSDIVQGYIGQIRKNADLELSTVDCETLFGNIETIWKFNRYFLAKLEDCNRDPIKIADCFVSETEGFGIYSTYCTNYPRSMETLTRSMKDEKIASFLKRQQNSLQHGLPLGSYLLKPVQRILKYHILLQNIFNNHDTSDNGHDVIEKALDAMMNVALHINEMKRQHEHAVRVQELQCRFCDWDGADLTTLGNLILEEKFRVCGAKALRLFFLFEKALLIAKEREDGMLLVKSFIPFSNLMVIESVPKEPLSFQVIPFNAPREQVTLQAYSLEQKRHWCHWIKKLMLENYGSKIPEKAKALVMTLGKSREEEDYESSNLEIPELVKKQHSAPEYLERRKGRRKSAGFIQELKLKPKRGLRSGPSTSDSARLKRDEYRSGVSSCSDVLPVTDDEESVSIGCDDDIKLDGITANDTNGSSPKGTPTSYKSDCSFESLNSSNITMTPADKSKEKSMANPGFCDPPASSKATLIRVTRVEPNSSAANMQTPSPGKGVINSKLEDVAKDASCGRQSPPRGTILSSRSVASLGKVLENMAGPYGGGSFRRSNSTSCELHSRIKDSFSSVNDDDSYSVAIGRRNSQESENTTTPKWYSSLRRPATTPVLCTLGASSLSQPSLEEPWTTAFSNASASCPAAAGQSKTSPHSCISLHNPSSSVSYDRVTSSPLLHHKYPSATQIHGRSPQKNNNHRWLNDAKFDHSLKSNLAKELFSDEQCDYIDSDDEDCYLNSLHNALTRLSSRLPAESLQSINSSSTAVTCSSSSGVSSEKSKNADRKDMRNKLARLLGRSPNSCEQKGGKITASEGSFPSSPSLADVLKDRHLMIGERMAVGTNQNFDSVFTIASRNLHQRPLLSDCREMFNAKQTEAGSSTIPSGTSKDNTNSALPITKITPGNVTTPQPDENSIGFRVRVDSETKHDAEKQDSVISGQFNNEANRSSETEFYYENKLLQDLEDGECEEGDCDDIKVDENTTNEVKLNCSPSTKPTLPTPRMTIKETLHSIERRSNNRPVRKVEVHLAEKAPDIQEILQTLENVHKGGHENASFYSKVVHRTVRDRSRELAVCAAITRVRQNNCSVVSVDSLTVNEEYFTLVRNQCSDVKESLEPENQTSHL